MTADRPSSHHRSIAEAPGPVRRTWRWLIGQPRDLQDASLGHRLSLIAVLAWVGLGADALSSSSYGPEEAFKTIGVHLHLAIPLAIATALTVAVIAFAYTRVVESFPVGGGYGVAMRLLGPRVGVVSGCALLVDYVLTITASIAAMGDALFSLLPSGAHGVKVPVELAAILALTVLNLRGVRESILVLAPVFLVFLITHAVLIFGGLVWKLPTAGAVASDLAAGWSRDLAPGGIGLIGVIALFLNAYAMGAGTYTGIEAVSNALPLMREPRLATARRTMLYMAVSLAVTAGGLILCYLLWQVGPVAGKTMNAVLAERFSAGWPGGQAFVIVTLVAEALLLVVAAQAGFVGGPRVMANLAVDGWLPRHFAALSDRLTIGNGVTCMGAASAAVLIATGGSLDTIVVMYAINVFVTFTLTMAGMLRHWWRQREAGAWLRRRRLGLFLVGSLLCGSILLVTVVEKFTSGAWITLAVTGSLVALCTAIRIHYRRIGQRLVHLYRSLERPLASLATPPTAIDRGQPVAVVLVSGYGGPGIHTVLNIFKAFPGYFRGLIFVSVGVLDSGTLAGEDAIEALRSRTAATLAKYEALAASLGLPSASRQAVGTDPLDESVKLCRQVKADFPRAVIVSGRVLFARERWYHRFLHNDFAFALQRRLQWEGLVTLVFPARI